MNYAKCAECKCNQSEERCGNYRKAGWCKLVHLCSTCTRCTAQKDPYGCSKVRVINKDEKSDFPFITDKFEYTKHTKLTTETFLVVISCQNYRPEPERITPAPVKEKMQPVPRYLTRLSSW